MKEGDHTALARVKGSTCPVEASVKQNSLVPGAEAAQLCTDVPC